MNVIGGLEVGWVQGFTNKRVEFVDNKTVCYICGNYICFLNLETKFQSVLQGPGRGLGVLTANGSSGIFAFSEQRLSPSVFVYAFPQLQMKNELKGTAQLDYTSLTLSNGGPYLGCCSSLPDYTITIWNWENAEPICTQPHAGQDVVSLVFNPQNWLQLCALGTKSITVWNIEKRPTFHVLKSRVVKLPAKDGSSAEGLVPTSYSVRNKLPYFGPEMLPSAISGLNLNCTPHLFTWTKHSTENRLTPTAICWTTTSELYVGCEDGFLLLLDPENLSVSVLLKPAVPDAISGLRQSSFEDISLNKNGLIAVGKDGVINYMQINRTQCNITQTWQLEAPCKTAFFSPDYEKLLLSSNTGQLYMLNPSRSDKIVKVLDISSGNFVAADLSHIDKNICVSVRDSGELQLWSEEGICLGSLSLQADVTTLVCCPIAQYAAVGTTSGNILFIDLNREQRPRLVHQLQLYHTPVDHLLFDQEGHYLITGASDSHIYILDAKPSKKFSVIGYTVVSGPILSLSSQCIRDREQIKVLALSTGQKGRNDSGCLLTLLSLPVKDLAGPDCADRHGCLSNHILKVSRYEVSHPLESCILGLSDVFAYCHKRKSLQRFELPKDTDSFPSQQVVQLKPEQEVRGHPLGPARLVLSPHQLWLASVGRDGLLCIRETASMEQYIKLQCHSCHCGGVPSLSFSADGQTLLSAGFKDGSIVCTNLRMEAGNSQVNPATQYSESMAPLLRSIFNSENSVLIDLPELRKECTNNPSGKQEDEVSCGADNVDVTEHNDNYNSLLSGPSSHPTWLESRREEVIKEENERYSETKNNMRKTIKELRDIIQKMMQENENLTVIERMKQREFNLDVKEQRKLEAMVEQEATMVREEIHWDVLAKCYLRDVLKRECMDSMNVKARAIKAFHSEHEVKNYPLKHRTEKEVDDLRRVQNTRKLETAVLTHNSLKKSSNTTSVTNGKQEEKDNMAESTAVTGSLSTALGFSNPYIYDQFRLQTTEQMVNQIILLQDLIYQIKTAFNTEFEAVHRQKVQELNRVRDRNKHIREIMEELHIKEKLWEPSLTNSEWPESLLIVDDSEIKAEKYLTSEQIKEEERKKLEEQKRLAGKGDNCRERALDDMMDGVLEVKKEDILKMEIPPPEFVLTKPDSHWSEEEKKLYKEYEKKTKDLSEEKQKYKKLLETEIKKLQASTKDGTMRFDETLRKLFEKKLKYEMAINQEELKITYLVYSVAIEEEMRNREMDLKLKHEKALAYKDEIGEDLKRQEEEVEFFQETYDGTVAEDKILDKEFRKEFFDVPTHIVDHLYKLFKRRPRVQKLRTQMKNNNTFQEQYLCGSLAPDAVGKMLKAIEELDAPENMPEGLNSGVWERFCLVRRAKVESEQKVKLKALTLAEMQMLLQKKRDEYKDAQQKVKHLCDELESMHKERNCLQTDNMVQVLLKQGQVEVSATGMTADYSDSTLIHRSVVEDFNKAIRMLGEQKIAIMVEGKDFRKGIIQLEWEHKMMKMQIEDLNNKARDIQMIHLSEEQQDYLNEINRDSRMSKQVSILEKTIAFQKKTHRQNVQHRRKKIKELNKKAAMKAEKCTVVDQQLPDMQVAAAELTHIYQTIASEENQEAKSEERYQEIVQRKKLEDLARTQAEELAFLWAELERLRMKNFPSIDQLKHN
ncbi:cilia- and flagella-associated protein 43 [Echeneis naucrates]|uniref:cilia- and flagella-associated protein 43 n=1 Tax=Echeneis naucrates TaxID=173247 RepID=UPI001113518E|nr:cilia- and flagella-associated protein 43 [Echeneis naucrates]